MKKFTFMLSVLSLCAFTNIGLEAASNGQRYYSAEQLGCDPNGAYRSGPCVCYCPVTRYRPRYVCDQKCVDEPYTVCKKQCRYVPEYYSKTYCRYVPEYYSKTFCRQRPEYYNVYEQRCRKRYYTEQRCVYEPYTTIERSCMDCPPACPQPACPCPEPCPCPSDGTIMSQPMSTSSCPGGMCPINMGGSSSERGYSSRYVYQPEIGNTYQKRDHNQPMRGWTEPLYSEETSRGRQYNQNGDLPRPMYQNGNGINGNDRAKPMYQNGNGINGNDRAKPMYQNGNNGETGMYDNSRYKPMYQNGDTDDDTRAKPMYQNGYKNNMNGNGNGRSKAMYQNGNEKRSKAMYQNNNNDDDEDDDDDTSMYESDRSKPMYQNGNKGKMNGNGNGRSKAMYQNGNGNGKNKHMISDQDLQHKVKKELEGNWWNKKNYNIQVEAKDGVVTLKGMVNTRQEETEIINRVKNMPYVKDVNSMIRVRNKTNGRY